MQQNIFHRYFATHALIWSHLWEFNAFEILTVNSTVNRDLHNTSNEWNFSREINKNKLNYEKWKKFMLLFVFRFFAENWECFYYCQQTKTLKQMSQCVNNACSRFSDFFCIFFCRSWSSNAMEHRTLFYIFSCVRIL